MNIAGLKKTKARVSILEVLEAEKVPIDVSQILKNLGIRKVFADQATVYRAIEAFYRAGIIDRLELGEGKYRYELSKRDHHHHLICENCGAIEDVEDSFISKIEEEIANKKKFKIKRHSLEFFGLCKRCSN